MPDIMGVTDAMTGSSGGDLGPAMRVGRLRDRLRAAIVVAVAALAGLAAVLAWRGYHVTFERYALRTESDAALMARDVERLIHSADLLLVQMVDLARDTDWNDPRARADAYDELSHLGGLLPESFRLHIFDPRGDVRGASMERPVALNVADLAYFGRHRAGKSDLDVSGLMRDRHDGTLLFTMSRRVPAADGGFAGVASVSFEPRIVGEVYREYALAVDTTFVWAHADGRVIVREPSHSESLTPDETLVPNVVAALAAGVSDQGVEAVLPDGRRHLVRMRQVGSYPYHVVVGTPLGAIISTWGQGLLPYVVGGVMALFAFVLGARRWLDWAAAEDRYREQLALLLTEKDALLDQKELLMREVDHRVKNSLQLVANLLDLQSGLASETVVRAQLAEARGRVEAVAVLHRSLHGGEGADRVDLAKYLGDLLRNLSEATRAPVAFVREGPALQLCNDTALSVGLIVNELVTNALKHAYPDGAGPVRVLLRDEGGRLRLRIADAGVGLPPGFDVCAEGNLGMRIVRMLVDGLGGVLTAERLDPGAAFEIELPRREAGDHSDPAGPKRTTTSSSSEVQ